MYELTLIVGRVGRDPELRLTPHGLPVTNFSVAVNHRYTDPQGQLQERVKWYRITAWRRLAEACAQYVKKGQRILVEGEVDASAWVDSKDGSARAALELTATTVRFLSEREEPSDGGAQQTPSASAESEPGSPF
jgi:single-strand DNA-binding protein